MKVPLYDPAAVEAHRVFVDVRPSGKIKSVHFPGHPGLSFPALAALRDPLTLHLCICPIVAYRLRRSEVGMFRDWFVSEMNKGQRARWNELVSYYTSRKANRKLRFRQPGRLR